MKNTIRHLLPILLLALASSASAIPPLDVTVSDAATGRTHQMLTKPDGTFVTGTLPSGSYVIKFRSHDAALANDQFLLILCAGKKTLVSNAIPGKQFTAGGAAVKMQLGNEKQITGQVASERELRQAKVKMVNGKRFIWKENGTGDNFGGRWVEESSLRGTTLTGLSVEGLRNLQERGAQGTMGANEHGPGHR